MAQAALVLGILLGAASLFFSADLPSYGFTWAAQACDAMNLLCRSPASVAVASAALVGVYFVFRVAGVE